MNAVVRRKHEIIIREPKPYEAAACLRVCLEALRPERFSPVNASIPKIKALIRMSLANENGLYFTRVAVLDGMIVGGLSAMVHEGVWFDGLQATVTINWCKVPGAGVKIIREFLGWARSNPRVRMIVFSTDADADPRLGKLLTRLGMTYNCPAYTELR